MFQGKKKKNAPVFLIIIIDWLLSFRQGLSFECVDEKKKRLDPCSLLITI